MEFPADHSRMRLLAILAIVEAAAGQTRGPLAVMLISSERFGEDDARTQQVYPDAVRSMLQGTWTSEREVLAGALKSPQPAARRCAASFLSLAGQGGYASAGRLGVLVPVLLETLSDPDGQVAFGAAMALAQLKPMPPAISQGMLQRLPHVAPGVQAILLTGLARVRDPSPAVVATFAAALRAASPGPQSGALAGLADNDWSHPELMQPVIASLASPDPLSRIVAAKVVARFGPAARAALPQLQQNLKVPGLLPAERSDIYAAIKALSAR